MAGRKKRSTFGLRQHRERGINAAAIGRRSWNENIDHYRALHNPDRKRSASELETMRRAAQRRPGGWAAKFLAGTLTRPDWAADNPNGETTARSIAEASPRKAAKGRKSA
jgi:hypothetical protein